MTAPIQLTRQQKNRCYLLPLPVLSQSLENFIRKITSAPINRAETFILAAKRILSQGAKHIIETGCSRGIAADGSSTLVLAAIAREADTKLHSYELEQRNIEFAYRALKQHGLQKYVEFHRGDSVTNIARRTEPIDFAYLDSYDCGNGNHRQAQEHQLAELEAVLPHMQNEGTVLLDDYDEVRGGKPKLALRRLYMRGFECLAWDYQILFASDNISDIPPAPFAVLVCHDNNILPLCRETIYRNKAVYAVTHGYHLQIERGISPEFITPGGNHGGFTWSRMKAMLDMVKSGRFGWVWCVGTDTLITNMQVTLESIVAQSQTETAINTPLPPYQRPSGTCAPVPLEPWTTPPGWRMNGEKHVIIAGEHVASVQADSFLVRGTPEGAAYLEDILSCFEKYKNEFWVENLAMEDRREKHAAITQIVPQHRINSYQYNLYYQPGNDPVNYASGTDCYGNRGEWQDGDLLIHWPGTSLAQRLQLLDKYQPKIIQPHMNIILCYTHILGKDKTAPPPERYETPAIRFLQSYQKYRPTQPHELVIVNCNPGKSSGLFDGIARTVNYYGDGWDCGTYQHVSNCLDCDLLILFNAFAYLWEDDWLTPFIEAYEQYGPGVYGATASYQNHPHLRTPCIAAHPPLIRKYPHLSNNRDVCALFEAGPDNLSLWAHNNGYPSKLVTRGGVYSLDDWRKPANGFRRGNQSDCLVRDRHTDIFDKAEPAERDQLAKEADTRV